MDRADLDPTVHAEALRGLARINRWSGSLRWLWRPIQALAATQARLRLLDVACGAGDVAIGLWQYAQQAGIQLDIEGCDISPTALAFAGQRAASAQADVRFHKRDVLAEGVPDGFDIITCSLFLHHLDDGPARELLGNFCRSVGRLVVISDLVRSRWNHALVHVASQLLSRSPVVHVDGPLSVEGALTMQEMATLAEQAGLQGATLVAQFPCRMLLTWHRPEVS
jgi:SAM-dependent methyltransferase